MFNQILKVLFLSACVAVVGCAGNQPIEGQPPDEKKLALEEVHRLLEARTQDAHQPPRRVEDLRGDENAFPLGFAAIRAGDVVVCWEAALAPGGEAVSAYHKSVLTEGGWVLLQSGALKTMTTEEFRTARK